MADQEYNLRYTSDNSDILAKTNVVIRALRLLDQIADRLLPKLKDLFSGAGRSANTASTNFTKAATAIAAVDAAAKGAAPNVQALAAATRGISTGTNRASASLGGLAAKMIALRVGREVFQEILDLSKQLEAHWQKMAAEASEFRESLRELASLKNQSGVNNDVTADQLSLSLQTGMMPEQAKLFAEAYQNIGPTVREKGHYQPKQGTKEQLENDILADAAQTARHLGIDEKAAGEAIGTAGLFHTFTSREDAMEQFGGAMKGLSEGKLYYTPAARALSKAASVLVDPKEAAKDGAAAGRLGSFAEAGVYMGALSLGTGTADQAQMRMIQLSRVLNPDGKNQDGIKALREAGVKRDMTDPEKLIRLNKFFAEKGITDPEQWLSDNNLGTVSTREKFVGAIKVADVLEKRLGRLKDSNKTNATGKATIAENARSVATDRTASAAQLNAARSVLNKTEGIEGAEEYEKAKGIADERFRAKRPGAYHSLGRKMIEKAVSPYTYLRTGVSGEGYVQERAAEAKIAAEGKRVGVDVMGQFPGLQSNDYRTRARAFTLASEAVKAKGGDPMGVGGLTADVQRRVDATRGDDRASRGGGGATDPEVKQLQKDQLKELQKLNAKVGGGPKPAAPVKPLPVDVDDAGSTR